jgi:hypothetical protein
MTGKDGHYIESVRVKEFLAIMKFYIELNN